MIVSNKSSVVYFKTQPNFIHLSLGGRDLQIMLDALCSQDGIMGTRKSDYTIQDVPLYWSNVNLSHSLLK